MEWFLAALAVAIIGIAAVAGSGRLGGLPPVVDDRVTPDIPDGAFTGDDVAALQFAVVPRGYDMEQVDLVLALLARQLDRADAATAAATSEPSLGGDGIIGSGNTPEKGK